MPRGLGEVAVRDGSLGGMTGRPTKVDAGDMVLFVLVKLVRMVLVMVFRGVLLRKARMCSVRRSC